MATVLVLLAALARTTARRAAELPVLGQVPGFTLLDQSGQTFDEASVDGRVWVASFVYTSCPGPCPLVIRRVRELQERFANDPRVLLVSFSVDPQQDTPAVLATYGRQHGVDPERWKLVTGDPEALFALVRHGFLLSVGNTREVAGSGLSPTEIEEVVRAEGPVAHSIRLVLVDPARRIRGYYQSDDPADVARLPDDLARLAEESAR